MIRPVCVCATNSINIYVLLPRGDVQSGTTNTPQISGGGLHRTPDVMLDFFHRSPLSVIRFIDHSRQKLIESMRSSSRGETVEPLHKTQSDDP